jgi:acyl carrier protein
MNPFATSSNTDRQYGAIEKTIALFWQEALCLPELPQASDNFFALGGDSTAMVMVEQQIQEHYRIDLAPGAILNAPSLSELVRLIETSGARSA